MAPPDVELTLADIFGAPVALDAALNRRAPRAARGGKILPAVQPNAGIEAYYRGRILAMVDEMNASIMYWLKAAYRREPPATSEMAQDELSSAALKRAMRALARRWLGRFDDMAGELAKYFATAVSKRSDATLRKILKDGGLTIDWTMTRAQREILNATIAENVNLIKSIPRNYLAQVEGVVMRSVQTGRDLKQLTDDLQAQFGVTRRRASFIARDQNNKATAALQRARQIEIGIDECIWMHSGGGREPRPTHVKAGADRQRYDPRLGWPDPALGGKRIWPGTEPNCRCVSRPVMKGMER